MSIYFSGIRRAKFFTIILGNHNHFCPFVPQIIVKWADAKFWNLPPLRISHVETCLFQHKEGHNVIVMIHLFLFPRAISVQLFQHPFSLPFMKTSLFFKIRSVINIQGISLIDNLLKADAFSFRKLICVTTYPDKPSRTNSNDFLQIHSVIGVSFVEMPVDEYYIIFEIFNTLSLVSTICGFSVNK